MAIIPSKSFSNPQMNNVHKLMLEECFEMIKSRIVKLYNFYVCNPELYTRKCGTELFYSLHITCWESVAFKMISLISSLALSDA